MKYVIVTPVKNEEDHVIHVLESMMVQTLEPQKWILVDDHSEDHSKGIIKERIKDVEWIELVEHKSQILKREGGAKVVEVFNTGYEYVKDIDFDFIVKLDADLTLPNNYFEQIAFAFQEDPKLGVAGGYCVNLKNGKMIREKYANYHIRGAFKSIRKECWQDIGGFKSILGWDGLDEMEAMYHGWKTKNLDLEVIHHRPTSEAYKNRLTLARKYGASMYKKGSSLFLCIVRAFKRLNKKPYLIYSCCFLIGYLKPFLMKEPKVVNKDLERFINRFHRKRIRAKLFRTGK